MQETNDQLMDFQEFLLETFYSENKADILQQKLATFDCSPLIINWIESFTPSMLEVAARMIQHWGELSQV